MSFLNRDVVTSDQFPEVYYDLVHRIMYDGVEERNERTGKIIRAYPTGGHSFTIDLESGFLPVTDRRRLFPGTAAAETAWYVQATQDPSFMLMYAKVTWEKFVEQGLVLAAYGYRWRKHFNRDQLKLGIEALRANPSDRRVYISAWDPALDGLGAKGQLNVPCPVGFTLSVLNGRLNSTYMLRSSDVFVGLPYDVMGHALLMDMVAASLGIGLGHMTFTLAHPHIYDVHFDMVNHFLGQAAAMDQLMKMPAWTVEKVEMFPHDYVAHVKEKSMLLTWPLYCPKPEVVQ